MTRSFAFVVSPKSGPNQRGTLFFSGHETDQSTKAGQNAVGKDFSAPFEFQYRRRPGALLREVFTRSMKLFISKRPLPGGVFGPSLRLFYIAVRYIDLRTVATGIRA